MALPLKYARLRPLSFRRGHAPPLAHTAPQPTNAHRTGSRTVHRFRLSAAAVSLSAIGAVALPAGAAQAVASPVFVRQHQSAAAAALSATITITYRSAEGHVQGQVTTTGPNPITDYHVDYGDGTIVDQHDAALSHWYATNWPSTITVTVTDSTGAKASTSLQTSVEVPNTLTRLSGTNRYETSAAVSRRFWADAAGDDGKVTAPRRRAQAVVLASGANFPDALAGVPLAAAKSGPLLLTEPDRLTDVTRAEITRILPKGGTVYVLGGLSALSSQMESALGQDGYHVIRYGGQTRYQTALIIAEQGLGSPESVLVATGQDFPDALAAGPMASGAYAIGDKPAAILLSDGDRIDDPATAAYVKTHISRGPLPAPQSRNAVAIGHQATVAMMRLYAPDMSAKEAAAAIAVSSFDGVHGVISGWEWQVEFFAGANRYETAAATAPADYSNEAGVRPYSGFASGVGFADALTGGAALAVLHGPLVLTDPNEIPAADAAMITRIAGEGGGITKTSYVFGGDQAVSQSVEDQLAGTIQAAEH